MEILELLILVTSINKKYMKINVHTTHNSKNGENLLIYSSIKIVLNSSY